MFRAAAEALVETVVVTADTVLAAVGLAFLMSIVEKDNGFLCGMLIPFLDPVLTCRRCFSDIESVLAFNELVR
jgi:hypothetical protein